MILHAVGSVCLWQACHKCVVQNAAVDARDAEHYAGLHLALPDACARRVFF
jgi:hypothetical protein